jgi:hypothetical protein
VFVSKNWSNDARVSCKATNNSIIDFELDLDQELNEFESSFEQDELKGLI